MSNFRNFGHTPAVKSRCRKDQNGRIDKQCEHKGNCAVNYPHADRLSSTGRRILDLAGLNNCRMQIKILNTSLEQTGFLGQELFKK